ncbi:MAG: hypothetical protein JXR84_24620 [Anaerolineae bacterium]|nr:hypothetical protein [Anaerolineae bacterium]
MDKSVLPVVVMPYHDPEGEMVRHLETILFDLKRMFRCVFVGVTPATSAAQPAAIEWLTADPFFDVTYRKPDIGVGEQFRALYAHAAAACAPSEVLHLCFLDRVAYALETAHRVAFIKDVLAVHGTGTPLMFHRSEAAWRTHPQNYHDIEMMATRTGEWLFGKTLDFAWCHLVIRAGLLREIMPGTKNADISMLAEMTLLLCDKLVSKDVDWLAWEDPFILGCDAVRLRIERENNPRETQKRLAYIMPTLQLIASAIS